MFSHLLEKKRVVEQPLELRDALVSVVAAGEGLVTEAGGRGGNTHVHLRFLRRRREWNFVVIMLLTFFLYYISISQRLERKEGVQGVHAPG